MESSPKHLLHKILFKGKKRVAPLLFSPLFLLILGPLPLLCAFFHFSLKHQEIKQLENKFFVLQNKFTIAINKKEKDNSFLNNLKKAPPAYLDREIETFVFLAREKEKLRAKQSNPSRLDFLENTNRLRFVEENIKLSQGVQETEERQERPVQMDEEDLKKLLTFVEGVAIPPFEPPASRPQLFFSSFDLRKKSVSPYEHVFEVSMNLIKREVAK